MTPQPADGRRHHPPGGRVVVVGDVAVDVVVQVLDPPARDSDATARIRQTGGGAAGNVASWLAHLGAPVRLIARVGEDAAGRGQREELGRRGVEPVLAEDEAAPTGAVVVVAEPDGTRTMYPDRGANLRLAPGDLPQPVGTAGDHLHLSGYALLEAGPRPAGLEALAAARAAGMSTSVDASSAAPLARLGAACFLAWIEGVDVLRASADEARVLAPGTADAAGAARALAARHPLAVVSDGSRGAWAAIGGGCWHVPAEGASVVDTVGAGDALTAGFLAGWLAGQPAHRALAGGVALAAEAVAVVGGRPPLR